MNDYLLLKQLAELATPGPWEVANKRYGGVIRGGPVQDFTNGSAQSQIVMCCGAEWMEPDQLEQNAEFIAAANPAAVLALIADLERHQRMLLAACMDMGAIGSALGADMNSDGEELLSLVVDMQGELEEAQADLAKEKTISKGWYENWNGVIAERDQLKAERDNLRLDRDGLLDAGAHLL